MTGSITKLDALVTFEPSAVSQTPPFILQPVLTFGFFEARSIIIRWRKLQPNLSFEFATAAGMKEVGPLYPAKIGFTDGNVLTSALDVVVIEGVGAAAAGEIPPTGRAVRPRAAVTATAVRAQADFHGFMAQLCTPKLTLPTLST